MAKKQKFESGKKSLDKAQELLNAAYDNVPIGYFDTLPSIAVDRFSSGIAELDDVLNGGLPLGKLIELYGREASGKSTVALTAVASAQEQNLKCMYIDAEHALNPEYMHAVGIDTSTLLFCQPDSGEQAFEIAKQYILTGEVDFVVIDSVDALVPEAYLDNNMGDSLPGLHARLMSQGVRKLNALADNNNCAVLFINQVRATIGGNGGDVPTGGLGLRFYGALRMKIANSYPSSIITLGGEEIGRKKTIKVAKSKTSIPAKQCEISILHGKGVDRVIGILETAVKTGLITKSGAWYGYNGENIAQGAPKAVAWLEENSSILEELKEKIKNGECG